MRIEFSNQPRNMAEKPTPKSARLASADTQLSNSADPPAVAILAGGNSRRMGRDKARLELGASTLLERVLAATVPLAIPCILIANDSGPLAHLERPVYPDLRPGSGPLGGLLTALTVAPSSSVLLLACDLPFITTPFLRFLLQALGTHQAVVPRSSDGLQPLCAVYTRSCLPTIESTLNRGDFRISSFLADIDALILTRDRWQAFDPQQLLFTNLNTPEDYQRAQELLREEGN
jgi:molybdopterin-guanine dinucleotide biosynthesis protein A